MNPIASRFRASNHGLYRLVADGAALYWVRCPATGGCVLERLAHDADQPVALLARVGLGAFAIGGDQVYVAAGADLVRVSTAGGAATVVATSPHSIVEVAVDDAHVYWSVADTTANDGRDPAPHPGALLRVARSGGPIETVARHRDPVPRLALDGRELYWTGSAGVRAVAKAGGTPREVTTTPDAAPRSLALDEAAVYYADGVTAWRVAKVGGESTALVGAEIVLDARPAGAWLYVTRNTSYARGQISQPGGLLRVATGGSAVELLGRPLGRPLGLAVDAAGVYVLDAALDPGAPATVLAFPR